MLRALSLVGTLLLATFTLTESALAESRVERVVVHARSLEGNLIGDSAEREVFIYLPPSYDTSDKRYPVVFLLHGYGLRAERWMGFAEVQAGADAAFASGAQELIIVSPDAYTFFDGSLYTSSLTNGDWENYIADELVTYVDTHYRTLATRESRGLAGHSMGGYGTLRLGMKYPQVFSALYPMSACCLFESGETNETLALAATYTSKEQVAALRFPGKGTLARAAAWSPNPAKAPLFLDLPFDGNTSNPEVEAKWHANSIGAMLDQYTYTLRRYTAIRFDVGNEDSLVTSNRILHEKLETAGVAHHFEIYQGDHNNRVAQRVREQVLPFFSRHLEGQR